jgi:hypothetical protein
MHKIVSREIHLVFQLWKLPSLTFMNYSYAIPINLLSNLHSLDNFLLYTVTPSQTKIELIHVE